MSFLPEDYEAPKGASGYMKLQDGENKFRILSKAIVGWEDWDNKRPVRFQVYNKPKAPIDPNKPIKHFWAFIVYNYAEAKIQILQVPQARIRTAIEGLLKDEDWGHPSGYDIKIVKKGEGTKTEYSVNPLPHKKVSAEVINAFNDKPIYLEAMFTNQDPFSDHGKVTPGVFESPSVKDESVKEPTVINHQQVEVLEKVLSECSPEYQAEVWKKVKEKYNSENLNKLPVPAFVALQAEAFKKKKEYRLAKEEQASEEVPF